MSQPTYCPHNSHPLSTLRTELVWEGKYAAAVREWREAFYIGASDTTIQLLNHWFNRAHRRILPSSEGPGVGGEEFEFRYYFCQREAKGLLFKHIVCDTPLGEAVDAGIVKTPRS